MKDLVSVIITSKNESDVLPLLLDSLKKQTYRQIEVIVVDNFSTDNTLLIAKNSVDKVYSKGPERSAQRNYGASMAKGNYLLFLDSDMQLTPGVIEECINLIKRAGTGAVVIPEKSVGISYWEKVKSFERSFYENTLNFNIHAARFFSIKAFHQAKGYDESITGPEDWDLSEQVRKLGYKILMIKSLIIHRERIPSLYKQAKKFYYYGLKSHRSLSKQNQFISSKTIHFLRPEFYNNWRKLLDQPYLSFGMIVLLLTQIIAGGAGYLIGKITHK